MRRLSHFVRSRLHRRLFVWFGASILATALTAALAAHLLGSSDAGWRRSMQRAGTFLGGQFSEVWDEPPRREALAGSLARDLGASVLLFDEAGGSLGQFGPPCRWTDVTAKVRSPSGRAGSVAVCAPRSPRRGLVFFGVLAVAALTLWGATGLVARRLTRPLGELVKVANAIGAGELSSRVKSPARHVGELADLAEAINDMADRIERQMADQRELLAAVSHEIRSPLARLRVLLEVARDKGAPDAVADDMEREVLEIDSLVGELLASSRLDFDAIEPREIEAAELAARALERDGLSPDVLCVRAADTRIDADPTLVSRALANLLDNAKRHGGGARRLSVVREGSELSFVVEDEGPGFAPEELPKVFDKFVRGERSAGSSLGLGLSLVRRIATAHGGRAFAENREGGGARVGFSVGSVRAAGREG